MTGCEGTNFLIICPANAYDFRSRGGSGEMAASWANIRIICPGIGYNLRSTSDERLQNGQKMQHVWNDAFFLQEGCLVEALEQERKKNACGLVLALEV